jgi:hypothetical protein
MGAEEIANKLGQVFAIVLFIILIYAVLNASGKKKKKDDEK